jgi:hypothetical protein
MIRNLAILLLILNLGLAFWGWSRDVPLDPPLPPEPRAPFEIRLVSEAPSPQSQAPAPAEAQRPAPAAPARGPLKAPASAYEDGAVRPLPRQPLPETHSERADPGLLPEELEAEPPIVVPPVVEDEPGPVHHWRRGQ